MLFTPLQWSLVCGERYLGSLAISTYFVGVMVGGVLFGSLSDKYGGRKVIIGTMYLQLVVGVAASFAPSFTVFVILRFFVGFLVQVSQPHDLIFGKIQHSARVGYQGVPEKCAPFVQLMFRIQ